MRSTLVVTQFAFTTTLVVFAVVVFKQTKFIREYDLGFKKDQMLFFYADRNKEISLESFKAEFYKIPGVTRLSNTSTHPSSRMSTTSLWHAGRESDESIKIEWILADHDYIPALELELVAGKNFNSNGINTNNVIINEKAAAALGWTPEEAIGKKVLGFTFRDSLPGEIVGVIKDFHIATLRKVDRPLAVADDAERVVQRAQDLVEDQLVHLIVLRHEDSLLLEQACRLKPRLVDFSPIRLAV
jgi:putative ABC transport system permease protein